MQPVHRWDLPLQVLRGIPEGVPGRGVPRRAPARRQRPPLAGAQHGGRGRIPPNELQEHRGSRRANTHQLHTRSGRGLRQGGRGRPAGSPEHRAVVRPAAPRVRRFVRGGSRRNCAGRPGCRDRAGPLRHIRHRLLHHPALRALLRGNCGRARTRASSGRDRGSTPLHPRIFVSRRGLSPQGLREPVRGRSP